MIAFNLLTVKLFGGFCLVFWGDLLRPYVIILCGLFVPLLARADGACESGYAVPSTDDLNYTTFARTIGNGCASGYHQATLDYESLYPAPRDAVARCPSGQYYSSGSCVSYAQGNCNTGYVDETPAVNSTYFERGYENGCFSQYNLIISRYDIGYVIGTFAAKCSIGYYPTANGCVAYTQSDCPNNYVGVLPDTAFARYNANGECDTNYSNYSDTTLCAEYVRANTADFCTPLCNYGYNHTHADTCARPCNDLHYLMTSNGIQLPLYLDKTTDRAMTFGTPNGGVCFLNLLSGTANGTINMRDEAGNTYHGVQ